MCYTAEFLHSHEIPMDITRMPGSSPSQLVGDAGDVGDTGGAGSAGTGQ